MDDMTVQAATADEARELAAERFAVDIEHVECREVFPETEPEEVVDEEESGEGMEAEGDSAAEQPAEAEGGGEDLRTFEVRVKPRFWEDRSREWVAGFLKHFGLLAEIRAQQVGTQIFVRLSCPEPSILIGRQGHTLEAIQHVVTRALTTRWPRFPEVLVDVESYKEKKLQRLVRAARSAAERAVRYNRPQELEPMTASERKYIHNALKDIPSVRTASQGREPNRHVVIEPMEGARPVRLSNDRRSEDRRRRGRSEGRPGGERPGLFSRPKATEEVSSPASSQPADADERLDWRPTFFRPPEEPPVDSGEPYPEVEDDLHT